MPDHILHDHHHDGIDRRGFLNCMAWAGTGVAVDDQRRDSPLAVARPIAAARGKNAAGGRAQSSRRSATATSASTKQANKDVTAHPAARRSTKINALTGAARVPPPHRRPDASLASRRSSTRCSRSSKAVESPDVFYVPGEHDVLEDDGKATCERSAKARGRRLAQLRPQRRPLHRPGQRGRTSRPAASARSATSNSNGWSRTSSASRAARRSSSSRTSRSGRCIPSGAGATDDSAQALAI